MNNTGKNELSGYKLFQKTCAETDQDRWHRQEVPRQNDFVIEGNKRREKTHDHQNTFARNISLPFQRTVTEQVSLRADVSRRLEQVGSKLFPLSTIIFTLDVPVIIINV